MAATTVTLQARRGMSLVASAASAVSVAALIALFILTILGHRLLVVRSDSMAPALRAGDVILVQMQRPGVVQRGDVVTFRDHTRGDRLVTHRVVERERTDGRVSFQTRGDANSGVEDWSISTDGRLGVVEARLPNAGSALGRFADSPWARTVVLAVAALTAAAFALRRIWAW